VGEIQEQILSSPLTYTINGQIESFVSKRWRSYQNARLGKLHPSPGSFRIILPRRFRELRAISIASWYLPDWLKFEILLSLQERGIFSLDFQTKGLERSLELGLLQESQETMLLFLEKGWITKRVLFGTTLQEDLESAFLNLRIVPLRDKIPKRKVRRKGYQDKGTWRPPDRWIERFDLSFNQYWTLREKSKLFYELFLSILRYKLRQ
jgi:hypothetical protein